MVIEKSWKSCQFFALHSEIEIMNVRNSNEKCIREHGTLVIMKMNDDVVCSQMKIPILYESHVSSTIGSRDGEGGGVRLGAI